MEYRKQLPGLNYLPGCLLCSFIGLDVNSTMKSTSAVLYHRLKAMSTLFVLSTTSLLDAYKNSPPFFLLAIMSEG